MPVQPMAVASIGRGPMPKAEVDSFSSAGLAEQGPAWSEATALPADAIAIGIDLGTAWVRAAVWDAEAGCARDLSLDKDTVDGALKACATFLSPSKVEIGSAAAADWAEHPQHFLEGVSRLLGVREGTLSAAKFIEGEATASGLELKPDNTAHGAVRIALSWARSSNELRRRGAAPAVQTAAKKKPIERELEPEQVIYRFILAAKDAAEAKLE
mgnify:CR=1 FL=1